MSQIRTVVIAGLVAFTILATGQGIWGGLLQANLSFKPSVPWSCPVMALALWALWRFLSGSPRRRSLLQANPAAVSRYIYSALTGAFAAFSLAGLWIVLFQLVKMPPNALPSSSDYPLWTSIAVAVTASLVAPFTEEAAFRGYCQSILERDFSRAVAVIITSALFAAAHLTHGLYWPKLLVYFLFGIFMGALGAMNRSILPGIPAHFIADLTFFTLVWPYDASRQLVWQHGASVWFWLHAAQFMVFGALALLLPSRIQSSTVPSSRPASPVRVDDCTADGSYSY